ncbi:MAG: glycosyltransferase family 39 protein [Candidatus Komeilibacteria bacterium]|nr:glycosyltransferase family 39 protein [Candidatus Komeilibacteria bacterium]
MRLYDLVTFKKYSPWSVISVIGITIFFIVSTWNSLAMPMHGDEGSYAYTAWQLTNDNPPYSTSYDVKPPVLYYLYTLPTIISPHSIVPIRIMGIISLALTILIISLIAQKEWGARAAHIAAWLSVPILTLPHLLTQVTSAEKLLLLPLLASTLFSLYYVNNNHKWPWILSGALGMIAILIKPTCVLLLLFIWLYALRRHHSQNGNLRQVGFQAILIGLGSLSVLLISLAYFVQKNILPALWENTVIFPLYFFQVFSAEIDYLLRFLKSFLTHWWLIFIYIAIGLLLKGKHILFYIVLCLLGLITVYKFPSGHYYFIVLPFFILAGAGSLTTIIARLKSQQLHWRLLIVAVTIMVMIWPIKMQYFLTPNKLSYWIYGNTLYIDAVNVAAYIQSQTTAEEKILVLGSEPQIYYLSGRQSVTRFINHFPITIPSPYLTEYVNEFYDDLIRERPRLIIIPNYMFSDFTDDRASKLAKNIMSVIAEKYHFMQATASDSQLSTIRIGINELNTGQYNVSYLIYEINDNE